MSDCEAAADVLQSIDNSRKDTCEIKGVVTTDDYVKKSFFSNFSVNGSLVYDAETGKTKCMDARTEKKEFAYNTGNFVKQEIHENETFYQCGAYMVHKSNDGSTFTVEKDPKVMYLSL